MERIRKILQTVGIVALVAVLVCLSFLVGRQRGQKSPVTVVKTRTDTLFICDTIRKDKPVFVYEKILDTVPVPVHDTLYVFLERTQRMYEDSLYRAWVSGIQPNLDSIEIYRTTTVIEKETVVPDRRRWGVGIQGGTALTPGGIQPYIGIGVSYNLITW